VGGSGIWCLFFFVSFFLLLLPRVHYHLKLYVQLCLLPEAANGRGWKDGWMPDGWKE